MKQKGCIMGITLFFIFAVSFFTPRSAQAVPAFARQTGLACSSCHFQHYPALNAFGRSFKTGGFTMIGGQSLIEGDVLSVPSILNASMVLKVRYQKTNGDDDSSGTNKGEFQFPDEAALLVGGRVGEHAGFLLEAQLADPDMPMFASFKMPFVFDAAGTKLSVIPFTTDAGGAAYGFELLNTGAMRMQRVLEHRGETSAQQYIGTATAAEGIAFVAVHSLGFVNATLWAPSHTGKDIGPLSKYVRAAVTPVVHGWDIGGGIQWWGGTTGVGTTTDDVDAGSHATHAWAIDAQAQGNFMSMPTGIYLAYASADKSEAGEPENVFNDKTKDKTAWSMLVEVGVIPNKSTVAFGYRSGENGETANNKQTATTLGATYMMAQNIQFQLNHTLYGGNYYDLPANNEDADGDQQTTLMLFTAF
ncbi:MAG: hypothetical protein HZA12_01330 [Nitrospirae bacterium]|nr:hypothetical protein [Nitrospirota bacterium]